MSKFPDFNEMLDRWLEKEYRKTQNRWVSAKLDRYYDEKIVQYYEGRVHTLAEILWEIRRKAGRPMPPTAETLLALKIEANKRPSLP